MMTDLSKIAGIKEAASGLSAVVASQAKPAVAADSGFDMAELAARRASLRASKASALQRGVEAGILPPEAVAQRAAVAASVGNLSAPATPGMEATKSRGNGIA